MASTLILRGGRVLDPESGHDAVADVVITDGTISAVGAAEGADATVIDVTGLAVAPGFIDLHSHATTLAGQRLQACDGVTTAVELEAGAWPLADAYARLDANGSPINYGFSASWAVARMAVVGGFDVTASLSAFLKYISRPEWQPPATDEQLRELIDMLGISIADGALGIGLLLGYAPRIDPAEYVAVAQLAATNNVATFTHARELVEVAPSAPIDGATEVVRAAQETGAHMHYCHVNSTSGRNVDRVLSLVEEARRQGATVTTEAYPYGAGSTGIGAFFLEPERLPRMGLKPNRIRYMPTGERVADEARLRELRANDPGGLAIIEFFDENDPAERDVLHRSLLFDDAIVASDAMPLTWNGEHQDDAWPIPKSAATHPRSAGTFSRSLRVMTRQHDMPLLEAIRRMTLLPAQVLESATSAMKHKGRLAPGADADVTVFDPATVTDQATYDDSTRPSSGIVHVLVGGDFVVRNRELQLDARPGRAIRGK
ncbi:MAG TPA: amidohydrolase family protein [Mycobacteriales bacterium]|nr:amidohydrolase family protein [Mycobacteriales bacterium]